MKNALELRVAVLDLIDQRRMETGDPELGANIERMILDEDRRNLDRDILSNPGALETQLVPVRRNRI
jgi:hypothetical protein